MLGESGAVSVTRNLDGGALVQSAHQSTKTVWQQHAPRPAGPSWPPGSLDLLSPLLVSRETKDDLAIVRDDRGRRITFDGVLT